MIRECSSFSKLIYHRDHQPILILFLDSPSPWHTVVLISTPSSQSSPSCSLSVESQGSGLPLNDLQGLEHIFQLSLEKEAVVCPIAPLQAQACKYWS